MAEVNIMVKPEIITWILQKTQFENIASSAIELLKKWQTGEIIPTFSQVEMVSKQTNIPFGYFFLEAPPEETCPIMEYSTNQSVSVYNPSRDFIDTYYAMMDIQDWMTDYLMENEREELDFVGSADVNENAMEVADDIRETLGLPIDWFAQSTYPDDSFNLLRSRLEEIGIMVMINDVVGNNTKRILSKEAFRAFALINRYAPLIFINARDSEEGKLFSLLHETAHVWLGINRLYNGNINRHKGGSDIEKKCNAIAAEILVPSICFKLKWDEAEGTSLERIESLSKYFCCGQDIIAKKALDVEMITDGEYSKISNILLEQNRDIEKNNEQMIDISGNSPDIWETRLSHNLVRALESSTKEGRTEYTEAYRLTGTNRSMFDKIVESIK